MKNRSIPALMLIVLVSFALTPCNVIAADYKPGEVLVKFKKGVTLQAANAANGKVQAVLKRKIEHSEASLVKLPSNISVEQAVQEYKNNPDVEYAQPNYIYKVADTTPNDPSFNSQWGLNNIGQEVNGITGNWDADIDAPRAWDITTGSASVVIAVIDTGVKWNHEDLYANRWENTGETDCSVNASGVIICTDTVDTDANGYLNDRIGWDFVNGDNNPADDFGHGTHVAGIIAAAGNNTLGISGVMWSAKVMPLKVLDSLGFGTSEWISSAIYYAANNGAHIINMSLGETLFCGGPTCDQVLRDSIAYAETKNVLVVAAAGNDGNDVDLFPTYPATFALDNVISVAATDQTDSLAWFSNFGSESVDLAAPGVDILSTVPTSAECPLSDICDDSGYAYAQGTSMASPHVAGVAGLYLAKNGLSTPYATVKAAIMDNVNHLINLSGKTVSGGRLNAAQTLLGTIVGPAAVTDLTATVISPTEITLNWTDVSSNTGYNIYRKSCDFVGSQTFMFIKLAGADDTSFPDTGLSAGSCYTYIIRAFNATEFSDFSNEASATTETTPTAPLRRQTDPGSSAGGGGCFIATAAYGSALHPYVEALRNFRDKHLLTNFFGRSFVNLYYKFSPPVADVIRDNKALKAVTRAALMPVIMFVIYPYGSLMVSIVILLSVVMMLFRIKRQRVAIRRVI